MLVFGASQRTAVIAASKATNKWRLVSLYDSVMR